MSTEWLAKHFSFLEYGLDGSDLDKATLRLVMQVNGRKEVDLSSRIHEFEPGIVAFVSKPGENQIRLVKILPSRSGAIVDNQGDAKPPPQWALDLLGVK